MEKKMSNYRFYMFVIVNQVFLGFLIYFYLYNFFLEYFNPKLSLFFYFLNFILYNYQVNVETIDFIIPLLKNIFMFPFYHFHEYFVTYWIFICIAFRQNFYNFFFEFINVSFEVLSYLSNLKWFIRLFYLFMFFYFILIIYCFSLYFLYFSFLPDQVLLRYIENKNNLGWVYFFTINFVPFTANCGICLLLFIFYLDCVIFMDWIISFLNETSLGKEFINNYFIFPLEKEKKLHKKSFFISFINKKLFFRFLHFLFFSLVLLFLRSISDLFFYWVLIVPCSYILFFLIILTKLLGFLSLENSYSFWVVIYKLIIEGPAMYFYSFFSLFFIIIFLITYKYTFFYFSKFLEFSFKFIKSFILKFCFFLYSILDHLQYNFFLNFIILYFCIYPLAILMNIFYYSYFIFLFILKKLIKFIKKLIKFIKKVLSKK